jgi:hypothetical protein
MIFHFRECYKSGKHERKQEKAVCLPDSLKSSLCPIVAGVFK